MAGPTQGDRRRARVTVTIEVPAAEASADQIRNAVARSLIVNRAVDDTRIVSVDAVEMIDSVNGVPMAEQPVDQYGRTVWESASGEQLAAEQGVKPIHDISELAGDFWPEDEGPDDFVNWLREQRRAG